MVAMPSQDVGKTSSKPNSLAILLVFKNFKDAEENHASVKKIANTLSYGTSRSS